MPDLSPKACHQFWHGYNDPTLYRVICFMESVEKSTIDGDSDFEVAISELGAVLDDLGKVDLKNEDMVIELIAFIKISRSLRVLQSIDVAHPGSASKLIAYARKSSQSSIDIPGYFLRRNIVFERLRLLSRVLAKERFDIVQQALNGGE